MRCQRSAREQPRGEHRRVTEWFRERPRHHVECAAERVVVSGDDMMDRRDVVRDRFGVVALVVPRLGEAHGIGVDPLSGHGARSRGNEQ